jgi:transcriptional regulator with XRE-family HTH domain
MREKQGMSQTDVARLMAEYGWKWHPQTVQKVEAGHRKVSVGEAEALAKIFGTIIDRLTWPGQSASAAALLSSSTGRAWSAWEQVAAWTYKLLGAQFQLEEPVAATERAGCYGSDEIRRLLGEAKEALTLVPETAVQRGREDRGSSPGDDAEDGEDGE